MSNKYIIPLVIISVVCITHLLFSALKENKIEKYEENNIIYEDRLSNDDLDNDRFKVQYQVKGIADTPQKLNILNTIKKVVQKIERIIPISNKLNYITKDLEIPVTANDKKLIKDIYVKIDISDANIKEDSGQDSKDTVGGANILETKTVNNNIFPTVTTIQLLKSTVLEELQETFDELKYPYTEGLNRLYYTLLHEMLHVLGVGFLWTDPDYDETLPIESYNRYWIKDPKTNPSYVGPSLPKYNNLSATVYYYSVFIGKPGELKAMPIEDSGLEGTRLWHWEQGNYQEGGNIISKDDRVIDGIQAPGLDNEIMVGWSTNKVPILSTITIANLEDLGYTVNYNEADVSKMSVMSGNSPIQAPIEIPFIPESDNSVRKMNDIVVEEEANELIFSPLGIDNIGEDIILNTGTRSVTIIEEPPINAESDYTLYYSIFSFCICSSASFCFILLLLIILGFM